MKKFICSFCALLFAASGFAFNFVGKTFRGSAVLDDGSTVTVTYVFKANGRLSCSFTQTGKRTNSSNGLLWEVSGDYINVYEPATGDFTYLRIEEDCDDDGDCDGVILVGFDSMGNEAMYFDQVKSAPKSNKAKKSTKKSKKK